MPVDPTDPETFENDDVTEFAAETPEADASRVVTLDKDDYR
ncbi:hypothetical protein QMK19_27815 [Streptomyces sp. H10-C2]|nr:MULTISPECIES: hypothetical protein [unclassified Streptomyces]MDJ0343918.1 hypothetical protein [Streptomyces sp. PH10-H1]MDJ0373359.1 hypothetical protein [Streptomyces sp. H10-C2]